MTIFESNQSDDCFDIIEMGSKLGKGQYNFSGQQDRSFFNVPVQGDNGTSSKSWQGTERARTAKIWDRTGRDSQKSGQSRRGCSKTGNGCSKTGKDVLKQENDVLKQENDVLKEEIWSFSCFGTSFSCFLCSFGKVILSRDVPGQRSLSRDICSCPCPGTKGHRDKKFFFVPGRPVLWKH